MTRRVYRSMGLPSAVSGGTVKASDPRYARGAFEKDASGKSPMQSYADQYVATPAYKDLVKQTAQVKERTKSAAAMADAVAQENEALRVAAEKVRMDSQRQKEHTDSRVNMARKKYGAKFKSLERRAAGKGGGLTGAARIIKQFV